MGAAATTIQTDSSNLSIRVRRGGSEAESCSNRELVRDALKQAFVMLRPDIQWAIR